MAQPVTGSEAAAAGALSHAIPGINILRLGYANRADARLHAGSVTGQAIPG